MSTFPDHKGLLLTTGYLGYRISKAAVSMLSKSLAAEYEPLKIAVMALHPGLVKTDLDPLGTITAEESAEGVPKVVDALGLKDTGTFKDYRGRDIPY